MGLDLKIKKADLDYSVEELKIKGKSFWPFFKVFFFDAQYVNGGTQTSFSVIQKLKFLSSAFFGWFNWLGKVEYLVFSNSDQRKLFEGQNIDKSADYVSLNLPNVLHIELPVFTHSSLKKMKFRRVVSHLPLRILESCYAKLFLRSTPILGQGVVDSLNADFHTNLDALVIARRFYAQYWVMKKLVAWKKPKAVFMVVPYMKSGYVLAAKELNVTVIEMQHGTINKSHFGYANYKKMDAQLYPDYLLSYGNGTQEVFCEGNITFNQNQVIPIGHFYLHLIQQQKMNFPREFQNVVNAEVSISVSLQDDSVGKQIVPFLNEVAKKRPEWLMVFVPRKTGQSEYEKMNLAKNILFLPSLNVYETIKLCHIHTTVFSTCALEAPSIGRPNVLVNIDNKSKEYFSNLLSDMAVTRMVNTVDEFIAEIEKNDFPSEKYIRESNESIIKTGFVQNLNDAFVKMKIQTK